MTPHTEPNNARFSLLSVAGLRIGKAWEQHGHSAEQFPEAQDLQQVERVMQVDEKRAWWMTTPNAQPKIRAIGASGRFAGLVVPELAPRNATVRAFLRDPGKADAVRARGATEVVIGDLRDTAA